MNMPHEILAILLVTFGFVSVIAAIPQLIKLLKLKSSREFSLPTWIIWFCYQFISVLYSFEIKAYAYALINSLWTLFYFIMIILIFKYSKKS